MKTFLEKSILDVFAHHRLDEKEKAAAANKPPARKDEGTQDPPPARPSRFQRPQSSRLDEAEKRRLEEARRRGRPSRRSTSMKDSWKQKREAMMKGWQSRKKAYGASGRRAKESMESLKGILAGIKDKGEIDSKAYEAIKNETMNYLYAVVADDNVTAAQVYESILFDIAPVMAIVEAVMDRSEEQKLNERDTTNLSSFIDYVDKEVLVVEPASGEPAPKQ